MNKSKFRAYVSFRQIQGGIGEVGKRRNEDLDRMWMAEREIELFNLLGAVIELLKITILWKLDNK